MNKASRWVWRGALRTVLGLPQCPDDLNEAFYTALVFDHHCFVRIFLQALFSVPIIYRP